MEITNSLIPMLSQADSPSQLSDGNPQAKNAKKKGQTDSSSFDSSMDGALMALISAAQAQANPTATPSMDGGNPAGKANAELIAQMGEQVAAKVELSTKNVAGKSADGSAENSREPTPTIASLFQAKAQQNANGTMADAFVAGPDRPWGSRWVFGGNQPSLEDMNATKNPQGQSQGPMSLEGIKKLVEQAKSAAQGGDESQLKQASGTASSDLEALQELVKQFGGEIEGVSPNASEKPARAGSGLVSGGDYLSAMNAAKLAPMGEGAKAGMNSNPGMDSNSSASDFARSRGESANAVKTKGVIGSRPDLQVLPGGISGGESAGRLEGGLRTSKDEGKQPAYETVFLGSTPANVMRDHGGPIPPQTITGHVVPGGMMKERLTSETLRNVSSGIQGMSANGGGEMRIKLNPGNLGELSIRISTDGKDVGLKVQASDSGAKKILEESLGSLRDSLAQQSLSLGRVDVVVASNSSQDAGGSSTQQHSAGSHSQNAYMQSQSNGQQSGSAWGNEDSSGGPVRGNAVNSSGRSVAANAAAGWARSGGGARSSDARLDVIA